MIFRFFNNIFPPDDHNRVKLNDERDYINASFVQVIHQFVQVNINPYNNYLNIYLQTYGNLSNLSFIAAQGTLFYYYIYYVLVMS